MYGQRNWRQQFWGVLTGNPLGGSHFLIKAWPQAKAYRLQGWDTSNHTGNSVGTQLRLLAYRLPKVFLTLSSVKEACSYYLFKYFLRSRTAAH